MSLIDLSEITRAYMNLLRMNINDEINAGGSPVVTITPEPPDRVGSVTNTLSIYAYHVTEDPYFKNTLGPGMGPPSVARAPMGLSLYYILTAHHDSSGEEDALTRQRLMGWALKSFHDIPVITDATTIGGPTDFVMPSAIRDQGNQIQTILRPITPEEAIGFWSTEDQSTTRLSAYYEARVIMLDAEPPTRMPGIVLSVGTFVSQLGTPQIACTRNDLLVQLPRSIETLELDSSPARLTLGESSLMEILGSNLSGGQRQTLLIRGAATTPDDQGAMPVDPTLNPSWAPSILTDRAEVDVQETLVLDSGPVTLFPGTYTVQIEQVVASQVLAGELREQTIRSNEAPFWILPRILSDSRTGQRINLFLASPLLTNALAQLFDVQLVVDGEVYVQDPPPGGTMNREWQIVNPGQIRFNPPFDATPPTTTRHIVQLTINGAAAMPYDLELGP